MVKMPISKGERFWRRSLQIYLGSCMPVINNPDRGLTKLLPKNFRNKQPAEYHVPKCK